jgi:hypothetical protein
MANFPISVCLIVKDQGQNLAKAIESIADIAAEVIIINSPPKSSSLDLTNNRGGLEETPNSQILSSSQSGRPLNGLIEKKMGLGGEFFFPWNDDLSAVRNFAIKKATQPWILMMDADCIFDRLNMAELELFLNKTDISIYYLKLISNPFTVDEMNQAILMPVPGLDYSYVQEYLAKGNEVQTSREHLLDVSDISLMGLLFRNGKGISFKGRVFEELTYNKNLKAEIAEIYLYHFNYTQQSKEEQEQTTLKLLSLSLAEAQNNSDALFYQSKLLSQNLNTDPGIREQIIRFNKVLKANPLDKYKFEQWYFESTAYLLKNNDLDLSLDILLESLNKYPSSILILFNFYQLLFKMAKIFECSQILKYMIFLIKKTNVLHPDIIVPGKLINEEFLNNQLAHCYDELSDYLSSIHYFKDLNNFFKYGAEHTMVQSSLKTNEAKIKSLEEKITEGDNFTLVRFKLAREYIRAQKYESARSLYFEALTKAEREEDIIFEKVIFSDLILYGKELALDDILINKIIAKANDLAGNFSYFWYCLGKYYFSTGLPEQAVTSFQKALLIEEELENGLPFLHLEAQKIDFPFIDLLINNVNDPLIKTNIIKVLSFVRPVKSSLEQDSIFLKGKEFWQKKEVEKAIESFSTIEVLNDYDKFVVYDYLALAFEKNSDYDRAAFFIGEAVNYYTDQFILARQNISLIKKYAGLVNSAEANFPGVHISSNWAETLKFFDKLPVKPKIIVNNSFDPPVLFSLAKLLPDCKLIYVGQTDLEFPGNLFAGFKNLSVISEENIINTLGNNKIDILFVNDFATDYQKYSSYLSGESIVVIQGIQDKQEELWQKLVFKYNSIEFISPKIKPYNFGILIQPPEKKFFQRYNIVRQRFMRYMYDDNFDLLKYCFEELGIEYNSGFNELRKDYNNILFIPYSIPQFSNYALDYTYIPYQMEQIALRGNESFVKDIKFRSYIRLLKNASEIWDYSTANIAFLNSLNINQTELLKFGYHEKMEVLDPDKEKNIDVLFYGTISPRRIKILDALAQRGYKTKYLWNLFGEERNTYIEKAKIILNFGRLTMPVLEEQRLSFLLNNRCFIISEKPVTKQYLPYQEGIVYCEYDKLIETCEIYLKPENEHLREKIARQGYETFKKEKMVDKLKLVLKTSSPV